MMKKREPKFRPQNPEKYDGNPTNIIYRSSWERRMMLYFDSHSEVLKWSSEEFSIPYRSPVDKRIHRYFPDFKATIIDKNNNKKTFVYEVKPYAQTQPPVRGKKRERTFLNEVLTYGKNMAKFEAANKYCIERDWEFKVLTEKEIYGDKT